MRNSKRHSIDKTKCVNTKKTIPFQFFITMKKNLFRKFLALFLTGTYNGTDKMCIDRFQRRNIAPNA